MVRLYQEVYFGDEGAKRMIHGISRLLAAASSLALASSYLLAWAGIRPFNANIPYLGYLILMEFVQLMFELPLTLFLAGPLKDEVRASKVPRGALLAGVAVLATTLASFGAVMSFSSKAIWPIVGVILLLLGKWDLYIRPPRTSLESKRITADAVVRVAALFFLLLPCVIIPFPSWNAPSSMEEFADFRPAGMLVWGASYFGLFGFLGHRLDKMVAEAEEAESAPGR